MTVCASARLDGGVEITVSAREAADRYAAATGRAPTIAERLDALKLLGWRVLADRRWVGSKRTTVDALLVGPGGVLVVDVEDWHHVGVVGDSVFCGDDCRDDEAAVLRSVTDRVQDSLSDLGVTRQALRSVLVFAGKRVDAHVQQVHLVGETNLAAWVSSLTARLEDSEIDALATVLERDFVAADAPVPLAARQATDPGGDSRFGVAPAVVLDVDELATAIAVGAMSPPLERWMTFLAPEQLALVTTSWNGPARITGAAGSGRTVVGLHRAAHLAERHREPVLFVASTAASTAVVGGLAARLAPQTSDDIVVGTLRDLAVGLVEQTGACPHLDTRQAAIAFLSAWMSVGRGGLLSQVDERPSYWQEEIDHVIKGRGITELDDYLALPRSGRLTGLERPQRKAVWRLYVDYQRRLEKTRQLDVNDVVATARDLVREGLVRAEFSAVVVDDAEDISLVGLELLHAIAGDEADRLLLLDDGQQAVRPGGCTLAEAGIQVVEPVVALGTNRRTSADLLRLASEVIGGDTHTDLEGVVRTHEPGAALRRRGPVADVVHAADQAGLDGALVNRLVQIADRPGVDWGDLAVLVHTSADLDHLRTVLMRAALPVVDVEDHGGTSGRVVVGTFDCAKGLEFDHVLMPGLGVAPAPLPGEHEDAHRERTARMRRERYVGITRARHGLWLGYLD